MYYLESSQGLHIDITNTLKCLVFTCHQVNSSDCIHEVCALFYSCCISIRVYRKYSLEIKKKEMWLAQTYGSAVIIKYTWKFKDSTIKGKLSH